jgi:hypothetical protein
MLPAIAASMKFENCAKKLITHPTSGKYKVYIIDEVHMLTKEAFQRAVKNTRGASCTRYFHAGNHGIPQTAGDDNQPHPKVYVSANRPMKVTSDTCV